MLINKLDTKFIGRLYSYWNNKNKMQQNMQKKWFNQFIHSNNNHKLNSLNDMTELSNLEHNINSNIEPESDDHGIALELNDMPSLEIDSGAENEHGYDENDDDDDIAMIKRKQKQKRTQIHHKIITATDFHAEKEQPPTFLIREKRR